MVHYGGPHHPEYFLFINRANPPRKFLTARLVVLQGYFYKKMTVLGAHIKQVGNRSKYTVYDVRNWGKVYKF